MERTSRHVADGPIFLQKSPQRFREIRIGNNRIGAGEYLNQCCASTPELESILRCRMGKIFLQQNRPKADRVAQPMLSAITLFSLAGRAEALLFPFCRRSIPVPIS